MELWRIGLGGDCGFAGGIWQIWARITDESTHPDGSDLEGEQRLREAASELRDAPGAEEQERSYCDRWIHERLDIVV